MTESGIAELRKLLRLWGLWAQRDEWYARRQFFLMRQPTHQDICGWLVASVGKWGEQINTLTPAELRQLLEFVLYAETDK